MVTFREMDERVRLQDQLADEGGPVVLVNVFSVDPSEVEEVLTAWAADAAWMRQQPGFISTQLHRGIAGSSTFVNYAVWESTAHYRAAFTNPEFQAHIARWPASAVISPHLFRKVAVPGICVA